MLEILILPVILITSVPCFLTMWFILHFQSRLEQQHVSRKLNFDSTVDIRRSPITAIPGSSNTHVSLVMHGLSLISENARTTTCVEETEF